MSLLNELTAISPIDGRYASKTASLRDHLSEMALFRYRLQVEVEWFIYLSSLPGVSELKPLAPKLIQTLRALVSEFNLEDAKVIKAIERKTNHDVKAVEYFLKEKMKTIPELKASLEFIHFACTSEDINNLAYALMWTRFKEDLISPELTEIIERITTLAKASANIAMLARTHGQAATPTTLGKELANYAYRLERQFKRLKSISLRAKFNGAVGNYNAHRISYPELNWPELNREFIEKHMGLEYNPYTTQIEPHDDLVALLYELNHQHSILIDLCQDLWAYISLGYFKQQAVAEEVGSSTMPHKINPIDFENAEGNLTLANALHIALAQRLPISRWQRDLVDSTLLRNVGAAFAYGAIAYQSLRKGLDRISVNPEKIATDLEAQWDVLAEAIQTVMRRYNIPEPYEKLKALTRSQTFGETELRAFIENLTLPEEVKAQWRAIKPQDYLGFAKELARDL